MQLEQTMAYASTASSQVTLMPVTELHLVEDKQLLPVCPRCAAPLSQCCPSACPHCGQLLDWHKLCHATVLFVR